MFTIAKLDPSQILPGDIIFVKPAALISDAIDYFERGEVLQDFKLGGILPSHVAISTGDGNLLEAEINGIVPGLASKYLDDPTCQVWVRRVADWTPEIGAAIVAHARAIQGVGYDFGLIGADLINHSFAGRLLNKLTAGEFDTSIDALLSSGGKRLICSEAGAECLRMAGCKAITQAGLELIDPQTLIQASAPIGFCPVLWQSTIWSK